MPCAPPRDSSAGTLMGFTPLVNGLKPTLVKGMLCAQSRARAAGGGVMLDALIFRIRGGHSSPRISPPAPPPGFTPFVSDHPDEEFDGDDILSEADVFGQSFGLVYRDAKGNETHRRVTVRALRRSFHGHVFMRAFCWERAAPRSFRLDRMQALYRITTGEVIENPTRFFAGCISSMTEQDAVVALLRELAPGLRTLLYIAQCDGEHILEERGAIRWYAEQRAGDRPFEWTIVAEFLDRQRPDSFLVSQGLKAIARDAEHARCLMRAAAQLIDADGEITAEETAACMELQGILRVEE